MGCPIFRWFSLLELSFSDHMSRLPLAQIIFYKCKLRIIFPNKSSQTEIPSSPFLREWHRLVLKDYLCVEQMDRGKSPFLSPCPFLLYMTRAKWDVFHFKNLIKQTEQKPILLVFTVLSIWGLNQGILGLEGEWHEGLTPGSGAIRKSNFWKVSGGPAAPLPHEAGELSLLGWVWVRGPRSPSKLRITLHTQLPGLGSEEGGWARTEGK